MTNAKKKTGSAKKQGEMKIVKFKFEANGVKKIMLAGDFNKWNYSATPLIKTGSLWQKDLSLKPGRYEYKFIVDGNWVTDPKNNNKSWNSFGTENSVLVI
ncbi:MAG: isoamylase early set domain-containing protein [Candidatus Omnitrophota bacterium]